MTPSDLVSLSRCAHRVRLDRVGDPAERIPAGAFLQLLWEGDEWERHSMTPLH